MSPFASLFKTKRKREKEKWMLKYGARLLQEIIATCDGNFCYPLNIFSANEVREAMHRVYRHIEDNWSSNYWATYKDRPIFMTCYSDGISFWRSRQMFFNEITTIVQLNHRNVVKLLGCCFEMESPILIFELVPNNLYDLLHKANSQGPIAWENRLRIAIEIADVVTYLHIAKPRPIIHRDIKSSNILLDEHCRPKLSGFYLSIAIPLGETHVQDNVMGTLGYLDPHYIQTSTATEKVDVYSFGWLLLELLTGKIPVELAESETGLTTKDMLEKVKGLLLIYDADFPMDIGKIPVELAERETGLTTGQVLEKVKSRMLIFDANLPIDTRKIAQRIACTELAGRCIDQVPDQRPTMKEVALQLRWIENNQIPCSSSASSSSL